MLDSLGAVGVGGAVMVIAGIGLIAVESLVIAAGIALVLAGTGLVVRGITSTLMRQFGLA